MTDDALLLLSAADVEELVDGEESAIIDVVGRAYDTHACGESLMPHSTFLRFPGGRDRMIALPAYLGGAFGVAGMKWIASFPGNLASGRERASGLVVLSSMETGRPCAVLEGSRISAVRTAASAALAADGLHDGASRSLGLLGCGAINFETLRFLLHLWPRVDRVLLHDLSAARAQRFAARCAAAFDRLHVEITDDPTAMISRVAVLSIATTAMTPHIGAFAPGALRTVLHLSLRDLAPALVLASDNVVDDGDHVCRAETSLHLAEREVGHRRFIRCTLADVLAGRELAKRNYDAPTIFSPFGLGILDIAVAHFVCQRAIARGTGTHLPFAPAAAV